MDQPTVSPCRSPDFWFDDGSVVLHVESTQFRVHRSVLSANSEVFRGMFSLPQPTTVDRDLVDGCPVVRLADKVVDWTHVLKALYCSGRYSSANQVSLLRFYFIYLGMSGVLMKLDGHFQSLPRTYGWERSMKLSTFTWRQLMCSLLHFHQR